MDIYNNLLCYAADASSAIFQVAINCYYQDSCFELFIRTMMPVLLKSMLTVSISSLWLCWWFLLANNMSHIPHLRFLINLVTSLSLQTSKEIMNWTFRILQVMSYILNVQLDTVILGLLLVQSHILLLFYGDLIASSYSHHPSHYYPHQSLQQPNLHHNWTTYIVITWVDGEVTSQGTHYLKIKQLKLY